jgi:hypothetical protein
VSPRGETSSVPENTTGPRDDTAGDETTESQADEKDESKRAGEQDSDSGEKTPTSPTPRNETPPVSSTLQKAITDLQAAAREVIDSGQIDDKKAEDLTKRVDELARHLTGSPGQDAANKVDELDRYLAQLSRKEELTPAAAGQLQTALQRVRQQLDH